MQIIVTEIKFYQQSNFLTNNNLQTYLLYNMLKHYRQSQNIIITYVTHVSSTNI